MRNLFTLGVFAFTIGLASAGAPELSLMQSAQTTRRPGAPQTQPEEETPQPLPGIVGVPTPPPATAPRQPPRGKESPAAPAEQQGQDNPMSRFLSSGGRTSVNTGQPAASRRGSARPTAGGDSEPVDFTFVQAPIENVVSAIMKELGYSYIIDPQVTGEVSVYTQGRLPRAQLFPILEQLLKMNGHGIVRQGELYIIVPLGQTPKIPGTILVRPTEPAPREASAPPGAAQQPEPQEPPEGTQEETPAAAQETPPGAAQPGEEPPAAETPPQQEEPPARSDILRLEGEQGVITYIIPLHFIPSSEMVTMAQAFVSEGATVVDFQSANTLLITDYRSNIEQVLNLVHLLDTQYFDLNSVDLVPVRFNKAADVAEDLGKVYAPGDKAGGVRIVAIERLNSILLVTHSPGVLEEVKGWIEKLDAPSANSNVKTFVYQVRNNTAGNIAEILGQLYSDGTGLPSSPTGQAEEGRQQQEQPTRRREAGFLPEGQQYQPTLGPSLSGRAGQSGVRAVVSGNVKIIVNEFNNSLIVQGTEADYQFLKTTIELLDVLPRQVLIEARIYAVELQDDLSFGVSAFLRERGTVGFGQNSSIVEDLPPPTVGSISDSGLSASTRVFVGLERQIDFLINALRSKTNVEMLEAPTLLVVDGTEAQINVGAEVPVTTGSFGNPVVSGTAALVSSISYRPTGTTLLLLPRISASGIVNMDLAIEVSSATGDPERPTINRNYVQTSLIAEDNQTIAIAGVISDSLNNTRSRVPLLGDIPILGALFGTTNKTKRRFELLFLITPRVVRNIATAVELTLDFKRALQNAYDYVNRSDERRKELQQRRRQEELEAENPPNASGQSSGPPPGR